MTKQAYVSDMWCRGGGGGVTLGGRMVTPGRVHLMWSNTVTALALCRVANGDQLEQYLMRASYCRRANPEDRKIRGIAFTFVFVRKPIWIPLLVMVFLDHSCLNG